jgi:hypothetical protein
MCRECCEAIVQTGGVKELIEAFRSSSQPEMQRELANALSQLCKHEVVRENFGQGPRDIFQLVQVVMHPSPSRRKGKNFMS